MYVCVTSFLDHVALSLRLLDEDGILAVSVRVVELAHIWFASLHSLSHIARTVRVQ